MHSSSNCEVGSTFLLPSMSYKLGRYFTLTSNAQMASSYIQNQSSLQEICLPLLRILINTFTSSRGEKNRNHESASAKRTVAAGSAVTWPCRCMKSHSAVWGTLRCQMHSWWCTRGDFLVDEGIMLNMFHSKYIPVRYRAHNRMFRPLISFPILHMSIRDTHIWHMHTLFLGKP